MRLRDLILEVRVFQNNFIKVDLVEEELKKIFAQAENIPKVNFDKDGMFITMDNFTLREYDNFYGDDELTKFTLTDAGVVDEKNNINKYYIEYTVIPKEEEEEKEGDEGSEEA